MSAEREVVRFLADYQTIWHTHFPALFRRAQWHIVTDLCTRGRGGALVGELSGLVKQLFLLDDSTVRERLLEIGQAGLCEFDDHGGGLTARTTVVPSRALLDTYDRHLLALAERLFILGNALDPTLPRIGLSGLNPHQRQMILGSITTSRDSWMAAIDRVFDAHDLSKARRLEARRHLLSVSHWTLLLMAVEHHHGVLAAAHGEDSILADQMAAALLNLTSQNFQTTRDHIAYLIDLGLLARHKGRSLRVVLAEPATLELDRALREAAAYLPTIVRHLTATAPDPHAGVAGTPFVDAPVEDEPLEERTLRLRGPLGAALQRAAPETRHHLVIVEPAAEARRVAIAETALTIGRARPSNLLLQGPEVSRVHCRVEAQGDQLTVTDLNSTNGTFLGNQRIVGTAVLEPGAMLRIGAYRLAYERQGDTSTAPPDAAKPAETGYDNVTPFRPRRPSGPGTKQETP
jgi:FHA domain